MQWELPGAFLKNSRFRKEKRQEEKMAYKVMGITAGRKNSNAEFLL